jgi:serine protease Do
MTRNIFAGLLAGLAVGFGVWAARPHVGTAVSAERQLHCLPVAEEPSEQDLWREMMRRAQENGGLLELDQNDPLGRELFERMQRGDKSPFGPGFEDMNRMMQDMFKRHGDFGPGREFEFGRMPEEVRKMLKEMHQDGGMPLPRGAGESRGFLKMLEAENRNRKPGEHEKAHSNEMKKYRDVVATTRASTVRVLSKGIQVALGTVVDAKGYVLTKASQLSEDVSIQLADGEPMPAKIVGIHEPNDLALLKTDSRKLTPVRWRQGDSPAIGSLLASPGPGQDAVATGVVSVAPRRPTEARGFLGVGHEKTEDGVQVTQVLRGTAADSAGIQVGDVIVKVDDIPIDHSMKLMEAVGNHKPGDKISLLIRRNDKQIKSEAVLGTRQLAGARVRRYNLMDRMGSELSERRDGFPYVLQHDSVLAPEDCGGPLVDLSGQVVGINIARAGRVASYAIPADAVLEILPDLMSGRLAPPEPSAAEKLNTVTEELRRAEAAKADTEGRATKIDAEIDRLKAELEKLRKPGNSGN